VGFGGDAIIRLRLVLGDDFSPILFGIPMPFPSSNEQCEHFVLFFCCLAIYDPYLFYYSTTTTCSFCLFCGYGRVDLCGRFYHLVHLVATALLFVATVPTAWRFPYERATVWRLRRCRSLVHALPRLGLAVWNGRAAGVRRFPRYRIVGCCACLPLRTAGTGVTGTCSVTRHLLAGIGDCSAPAARTVDGDGRRRDVRRGDHLRALPPPPLRKTLNACTTAV